MGNIRSTSVKTPLGPEDLLFAGLSGRDEISRCYRYKVTLESGSLDLAAADLLGEGVTVTLVEDKDDDTPARHFHGLVNSFGPVESPEGDTQYVAVLRPWLWFLSKTTDNRIFQGKSVIEIIEEVFSAYPQAKFEKRLQETYPPREYCVQYGESDLDFVQRLLEHEGIFYFFEHAEGEHTLILTDAMAKLVAVPDFERVLYRRDQDVQRETDECMRRWQRTATAVSGSYTQTDYDFLKPSADLMAMSEDQLGHALDDGKQYHYPGTYTELTRGDGLTAIRRNEVQGAAEIVIARGTTTGLWPGATFTLHDHPRAAENEEYVVLAAEYELADSQYRSGQGAVEGFFAKYRLAPKSHQFRPARRTPRPVMKGPQTAVVVGPSGEEIYTDEFSRVKVQFHWDRQGKNDENTTCFIRVSSVWAGSGFGFIQIPRIGQEVIVDFLEGDPDQPIITGRVYNASQMPPYPLPGEKTKSGWMSRSSLGGSADNKNELMFEDMAGSELVYFQAEKDHTELIKNDEWRDILHDWTENVSHDATQNVGHNRDETVSNNKTTEVGVDRTVKIGNNDTESVGVDRSLSVGSNETISVGSNSSETIGANHSQDVGMNQTLTVGVARTRRVGAAEAVVVGAAQSVTVGAERSVSVASDQSHTVGADDSWNVGASQTVSVASDQSISIGANQSLNVGGEQSVSVAKTDSISVGEDMTVSVGKTLSITAADEISIVCGSSKLVMKKDGTITLEGKDISITGSGKISVKASKEITMKGSKILQN